MKHHIVISYHSFNNPINKGLLLQYLKAFQNTYPTSYRFHLITFEQRAYQLEPEKRKSIEKELKGQNIHWKPVNYHTGGAMMVFKKAWDFLLAAWVILIYRLKFPIWSIIGFTSISSVLAFLLSRLIRVRCVCFNVEPHSKYMRELGLWNAKSMNYKLLDYLENLILKKADYVAVPTRNALRDFSGIRKELQFVPTSIEINDFNFSENSRKKIRDKFKIIDEEKVLIYVGKFDGIYFSAQEIAAIFKKIEDNSEDKLYFLVITGDNTTTINEIFSENGPSQFAISGSVPYENLYEYLSMADVGVLFLPPFPSQSYRCPIKTANYLACGLPILVNENVGDDPWLVKEKNVGWVIDLEKPIVSLNFLPSRSYCRSVVSEERSINHVTSFFDKAISSLY
ncbi:MAG: glycosyltransferase [Bacteroidota bacterium]